jgi:hypothetical protein
MELTKAKMETVNHVLLNAKLALDPITETVLLALPTYL